MNSNSNEKPLMGTPRPLSKDQFHSLRDKVVKESPKLYRQKILSDPNTPLSKNFNGNVLNFARINLPQFNNDARPQTVPNTPFQSEEIYRNPLKASSSSTMAQPVYKGSKLISETLPDTEDVTKVKIGTTIESSSPELGNFENPILGKLVKRSISKEFEIQKIIINVISIALFNLLSKFSILFINHSKVGRRFHLFYSNVIQSCLNNFWNVDGMKKIYFFWIKVNYNYFNNKLSFHLTAEHLIHGFYLLVAYNIILSMWKLFMTINMNDINLNEKQRTLLGLNAASITQQNHATPIMKPHIVKTVPSKSSKVQPSQSVPSTPLIFKSLKTPMKSRQEKIKLESTKFNKLNAFGDNLQRNTILNNHLNFKGMSNGNIVSTTYSAPATTVRNKGYIPSSKYSYMMNSPSPSKKI
ncbi:hypothetical protein KAFR_0J01000 [Kazachstania africana CBS 2517]|uniref:Nucleoporin POM34 n=1 Tax=Kazachstania africana (strain ATCC 22294 / BCRC 22015 / CBS 2517 / CECT 1963 / NBRC 1671 / NRRL Y-8276) TaxID=1071382 RepID=H2B0L8_KAZAF|nr:hypothetical protein KAFR_0J01000 [Kazachstania africana CBS 2517]CCF60168.1 hypothetical protein KAFR_0J01000 [Kazachstania africana CBS 2517]